MEKENKTIAWKTAMHTGFIMAGGALIAFCIARPDPLTLLLGLILLAIPTTVGIEAAMRKISDIRYERKWKRGD